MPNLHKRFFKRCNVQTCRGSCSWQFHVLTCLLLMDRKWDGGGKYIKWYRKCERINVKRAERVTREIMKRGRTWEKKEWNNGINGETVKTEWVKRESRYLSVVGGLRKRLTPLRSRHCSRGGTLQGVPSCAAPPQPGVMTSSPEDSIRLFPLDFLFPLCLLNLHESPALLNWIHALENVYYLQYKDAF